MLDTKRLREARGFWRTRGDVCDLISRGFGRKMTIQTLGAYENGKTEPNASVLWMLARLYDKPLDFFFAEKPNITCEDKQRN